jgi:triacylglycerol lipase
MMATFRGPIHLSEMPVAMGRRWAAVVVAGLLIPLILTVPSMPRASASEPGTRSEGPGPAMLSSRADRIDALSCSGDLDDARRAPVLLVPGTALTPEQHWGPTYRPVLLERGHAVCMVRLPAYATRDVQANIEYVATAIRTMAARSSRRISIIGGSQGALLPQVALRTWPDLPAHVDDVIGVAGVYDRGSEAIVGRCESTCLPVLHQLATGSAFLASIGRRPLPDGLSYTNIGTRGDQTVTPQPAANRQPGATSILVQDVCPGRDVPEPEHAMLFGDAVALALTLDALDHAGAASAGRLYPWVCLQESYPEFDRTRFRSPTSHASGFAAATQSEPTLYCRSRRTCRNPRLRGFLTTSPRYTIGRNRVTVRTQAHTRGRIRIVLGNRAVDEAVRPGPVTMRIRRPADRSRLVVRTRPQYYTAWATEDGKWIRARPMLG